MGVGNLFAEILMVGYPLPPPMTSKEEQRERLAQLVQMRREEEELAENLKGVDHLIAVMSGKGGVGKSTVAVFLGYFLSRRGYRVGILDADLHGPDVPLMLGVEGERLSVTGSGKILPYPALENLDVVSMSFMLERSDQAIIWRGPLKMKAIRQLLKDVDWGRRDFLIIDLPPGTGDEPLSIAQLLPRRDGAVVVTTPQEVSLLDARKAISFSRELKFPVLGLIENMSGFVCPHCGKITYIFKRGGGERVAQEMDVPFLGRIPMNPKVVEAGDGGIQKVLSEGGEEMEKLFGGIVERLLEVVSGSQAPSGQ